jgi:NIMA (never in mitosis gene a)-related kinase 1/4/5
MIEKGKYFAGDLFDEIEEQKERDEYFDEDLIVKWFLQITSALLCAQKHNIIHRDIKPSNIFLSNEKAKLGDFGLAKVIEGEGALLSDVGTFYYMVWS